MRLPGQKRRFYAFLRQIGRNPRILGNFGAFSRIGVGGPVFGPKMAFSLEFSVVVEFFVMFYADMYMSNRAYTRSKIRVVRASCQNTHKVRITQNLIAGLITIGPITHIHIMSFPWERDYI